MYDLHCHLDGSLSEECIKNLAQEAGISIDGKDLSKELRADENCESLAEYLTKFDLPLKCLISENSFTKAVLDVMKTAAKEHVVYMEIRFAPMLSVTENFSAAKIIEGALKGLSMGRKGTLWDRRKPDSVRYASHACRGQYQISGNGGRVLWIWSLCCGFSGEPGSHSRFASRSYVSESKRTGNSFYYSCGRMRKRSKYLGCHRAWRFQDWTWYCSSKG